MSIISFRQVASEIDRLYPPASMRDLAGRFRYPGFAPGKLPPGPRSFRYLAHRVSVGNPKVEFLHYNTWLLAATFDLKTFLKSAGKLHRLVTCLSLSYADVLAEVLKQVTSDKVCDTLFEPVASVSVCGVSVSVNPANTACKLVGSLSELVSLVIEEVGEDIDAVLDLFDIPADFAIDVILTFAGLNPSITLKEKPDMNARASEIGKEVFRYDWVSLCEVWDSSRRSKILAQGAPVQVYTGPQGPQPGEWKALGSGLLIFSTKWPLAAPAAHVYAKAGVTRTMPGGCDFGVMVDSDLWAKKGIQLTILDLGLGKVDLYSTHLYSGGDMADIPLLGLNEPTEQEKADVRAAQVDELVAFISQTHDPRHVAIIVGDFNIAAKNSAYTKLASKLGKFKSSFSGFEGHQVQFDDWWSLSIFRGAFPKEKQVEKKFHTQGHTNRSEKVDTFDTVCAVFPPGDAGPQTTNANDYYCDEGISYDEGATGERIDYIFIERPTKLHGFILDVSRIRRRAFKRSGSHPPVSTPWGMMQPQLFLSDHLGMEVTLFASLLHQPAVP